MLGETLRKAVEDVLGYEELAGEDVKIPTHYADRCTTYSAFATLDTLGQFADSSYIQALSTRPVAVTKGLPDPAL